MMNQRKRTRRLIFKRIGLLLPFIFISLTIDKNRQKEDNLYNGFKNPPAEARPFIRWWWNGDCLQKNEIIRELDILKKAGIGGVEINPIAMPEEAKNIGLQPLTWLSKEWNEMLKFAAQETQKRGMIADMIVGSGWPFGGEFLKESETIQRMIVHEIPCSGGQSFNEDAESLYKKATTSTTRNAEMAKNYEIVFIRLVPVNICSTDEIIDVTNKFKNKRLVLKIPPGKYKLIYGILQRNYREVMHGAPGAAGPVMNHFNRKITRAYLDRLTKISEDTGIPLSELIRALFCDSIELSGANWTDGFEELFFSTYDYHLDPWLPFIFSDPVTGYSEENYKPDFYDKVKRVRYDYNKLLVQTFLKNFTQEFKDFCTEQQVLCRYQAYGTPFLMGMLDGYMIPDMPESNNWLYSSDMEADEWNWNQRHGYMIWNLYAAAGGHLTGRKIISCEAMTNTQGVFKTSLEEIKQHDDMNFITGITHSILHGYNYSPPAAGFPGWVRYGTYFSEQNTWWPYFSKWVDYNARLSYVFQHSQPEKKIAILAPEGDMWSNYGLTREPFHTQPWYCHRLWEPISQTGSSCDYINERILREGNKTNGKLTFGNMSYEAVFLCSFQSILPETAQALRTFVQNGGTLVAIDGIPKRSLSFQNAFQNDSIIKKEFALLQNKYPKRFFVVSSPESEKDLLTWTDNLLKLIHIQKDVKIDKPNKNIFQIHQTADDKNIYFFVNSNKVEPLTIEAVFPTEEKTPWIWNPENGTRQIFPYRGKKEALTISLNPLQSMLIVFEPNMKGEPVSETKRETAKTTMTIEGPWKISFHHVNGQTFTRGFDKLKEFSSSDDKELNSFAGMAIYQTTFTCDGRENFLDLGEVEKGITGVYLNGKKVGIRWYGKHLYNITSFIKEGKNSLEIRYTTVLANYCKSLKDNPTAQKWTRSYEPIRMGIKGPVKIIETFYR